jgi:glyoxylase-like metal-dependent hydrolase (beta-lactamase superfamily II)
MNASAAARFAEIADRVYVARYAEWDVNVGLVVGADGVLAVDTRASERQGSEVLDDVRAVAPHAPVRWVVNTHAHFDHVLGNASFTDATVWAHETAREEMPSAVERIQRLSACDQAPDPDHPELTPQVMRDVANSTLRLPDRVFSSVATIDLGGRYVELAYPGRGHTGGDLLLRVPDADVVFAGDLVEQSGPPSYGTDCYPLDWPATLDLLIGTLTEDSSVVPGHGTVVGRDFVQSQRADISDAAELIRSLATQGIPLDRAIQEGARAGWPFPAGRLEAAVSRGYAQVQSEAASTRHPGPTPGGTTLPLA